MKAPNRIDFIIKLFIKNYFFFFFIVSLRLQALGVLVFGGDYLSRDQALSQTRETKKPSELNGKKRNRKELKKLISKLTRETNLLEETISDQEAQIRNIDLIFSGKDFFKNADNRKIENMQTSKIELEQELKLHMREWETKTHELEEARTEFEN